MSFIAYDVLIKKLKAYQVANPNIDLLPSLSNSLTITHNDKSPLRVNYPN